MIFVNQLRLEPGFLFEISYQICQCSFLRNFADVSSHSQVLIVLAACVIPRVEETSRVRCKVICFPEKMMKKMIC